MKQSTSIIVTDEHHKAMSWCLKNNIKIYPKVVKNGFRIEINDNGKLGEFEVAPDFHNGGVYKPIDHNNKRFEVIKDNSIPF